MASVVRKLQGKVALVTGASRGIGRATALELGAAGATVYLTARSLDRPFGGVAGTAADVAAQINEAGGRGIALRCDHSDDEQVAAVLSHIERSEGALDVLVNNAFGTPESAIAAGPTFPMGKPFWEAGMEPWEQLMNVGFRSHFAATLFSMPLLLKSNGLVVNISSPAGQNYFYSVHTGIQKSGVDRMVRDMAHEVGKGSVTFVSLWPGFVFTEAMALYDEEKLTTAYRMAVMIKGARDGQDENAIADPKNFQSETPHFTGRAVAALAADPRINRKTGRVLSTVGAADEYGFTDIDGSRPDAFGLRDLSIWRALAD